MEIRKLQEKAFHNAWRDDLDVSPERTNLIAANRKWYSIVRSSKAFTEKLLFGMCKGKKVLDYCCGNGTMSCQIAGMGAASVTGIDISEISIQNARRHAIAEKLDSKTEFLAMDAENMSFPNNFFDVIYEAGVLHHLSLKNAYSELARVLKPDGECLCVEALGHNKLAQLYRRRTPSLRTKWETEHILLKKDLDMAKKYFNKVRILGFFHLSALLAVPFRNTRAFDFILRFFEITDKLILKIPFIRWQAWQVIFILAEPKRQG